MTVATDQVVLVGLGFALWPEGLADDVEDDGGGPDVDRLLLAIDDDAEMELMLGIGSMARDPCATVAPDGAVEP